MKTLMIIFLLLFLLFGAVGLITRLTYDWRTLGVRTQELDEYSAARRVGKAMQVLKIQQKERSPEQLQRENARKFRIQTLCSVLSALCLIAAMVCGAILRYA